MDYSSLHIGIIMDGNRRWAKKHNLALLKGHQKGYANFKKITEYAFKVKKIKALTYFAFSTENWKRSKKEVSYMMNLFDLAFNEIKKRQKQNEKYKIQIRFIGDLKKFPLKMQKKMFEIMEKTKNNNNHYLNIALNYGGRDEIIRAVKKIAQEKINPDNITEELISSYLDTSGIKDPDLIIRTSGEQRLSGFLTWQNIYSELYFTPKLWPEFSQKDFDEALDWFSKRQRRFGS
jgi:undecaprenyl diphosphate synthase